MVVRSKTTIVLHGIASVEELTDVSTNVLVYEELASRMMVTITLDIKNQIIKNNKFLTFFYSSFKFIMSHRFIRLDIGSFMIIDYSSYYFKYE
jgi:hypothetical protein